MGMANFWLGVYFDPDQATDRDCADLTAAIDWYSRAIAQDETLAIAYINRASLYSQNDEPGRALDDFEAVLALKSTHAVLGGLLASQAALQSMEYDRAIDDAQAALDLSVGGTDDWFADLIHTLGMAYLLSGDQRVGLTTYERLPELDGETTQAFIGDLESIRDKSTSPGFSEAIDQAIAIVKQSQAP
jgi:tetratricopeptide (TPR) repeat protein